MKKNVIKAIIVAVVGLIAGINVFNAQKPAVLSDVVMANVEALASCESPVEKKKGIETTIDCVNDNGELYYLTVCDFDEGYETICVGRSTR